MNPLHRLCILTLCVAAALPTAHAAGVSTVSITQRAFVRPKLPANADVPINVPEDGAVKLPFVTGGALGVAARINQAVWRKVFDGAVAPTSPGKTFTARADALPQGITTVDYTTRFLPAINPRLVSFTFSGEGCGAYCEEFTEAHTFDLRDGREIAIGDLLTLDGFVDVGRRVDADRKRKYQKEVTDFKALIKASSKSAKGKKADDDPEINLKFNQDCLDEVRTRPSTPQWLGSERLFVDDKGGIVISVGRCSNHAMQALDDVGNIDVTIPADTLKADLTPYGLTVLQGAGDAPAPLSTFSGRELHGRLGGMPVTMTLEPMRDGAQTKGAYFYDKIRTPIALSVQQDNDHAGFSIRAFEMAVSAGEINLVTSGASLVGTWESKDHEKQYALILQ